MPITRMQFTELLATCVIDGQKNERREKREERREKRGSQLHTGTAGDDMSPGGDLSHRCVHAGFVFRPVQKEWLQGYTQRSFGELGTNVSSQRRLAGQEYFQARRRQEY